jgi:hypothetical protein
LVGNVCKAVLETGVTKPMAVYCIIHQQTVWGKCSNIWIYEWYCAECKLYSKKRSQ